MVANCKNASSLLSLTLIFGIFLPLFRSISIPQQSFPHLLCPFSTWNFCHQKGTKNADQETFLKF